MSRRARKRPVTHRKTAPIESMIQLLGSMPDNFALTQCSFVEHRIYNFGYSVLYLTDTDNRVGYLPLPASHFVMFKRNPV